MPINIGSERALARPSKGTTFIISSFLAASGEMPGRSTHFKASGSSNSSFQPGGNAAPQ